MSENHAAAAAAGPFGARGQHDWHGLPRNYAPATAQIMQRVVQIEAVCPGKSTVLRVFTGYPPPSEGGYM